MVLLSPARRGIDAEIAEPDRRVAPLVAPLLELPFRDAAEVPGDFRVVVGLDVFQGIFIGMKALTWGMLILQSFASLLSGEFGSVRTLLCIFLHPLHPALERLPGLVVEVYLIVGHGG